MEVITKKSVSVFNLEARAVMSMKNCVPRSLCMDTYDF